MDYTAIILAGGKSRRFGRNKTALEINGEKLIYLLVEKCRPFFSEIIIAGGERAFGLPGIQEVNDVFPDAGPLAGIHAGLSAASNETCFVIACDMPNINLSLAGRMLELCENYDVVLPKTGECVQPLFAVYKKSVCADAESLLSQNIRSVLRLFDIVQVRHFEMPACSEHSKHDVFFNINYQEDYEMFKETPPPVLSVVGFSDSGKTTYLEILISALKKRGLVLGVIKHDAHGFDIDIPGKDSWRLTQAGADITVIASPAKIAILEKWEREEDVYRIARRLKGKVDLVLTEGYKRDKAPKIEIRRAAKSCEPFCEDFELFAVASDCMADKESSVPLLPLDDAEPMADLIIEFLERGGV